MARLGYSGDVEPKAQIAIHYGTPVWRAAYAERLQAPGDHHFRLGGGFWTTLDTSVPLAIGDTAVEAGIWYLGLFRSGSGDWALTLLSAERAHRMQVRPGAHREPPVDLTAPLQYRQVDAMAARRSIELAADPAELGRASLRMRWGGHMLTGAIDVAVESTVTDAPPFALPAPERARTTPSGLRYEILAAGEGEPPGPGDTVRVRYAGWLENGELFDRSPPAGLELPLDKVIAGWREAVQLLRPGGKIIAVLPSALAYGERGVPGRIPPDAVLVFEIELLAPR